MKPIVTLLLSSVTMTVGGCVSLPEVTQKAIHACPDKAKSCITHFNSGVSPLIGGGIDQVTFIQTHKDDGNVVLTKVHDSTTYGTAQTILPSAVGTIGSIVTGGIVSRNQRMGVEHASKNMADAAVNVADRQAAAIIGAANIAGNTARDVANINGDTTRYAVDHAPQGPTTTFNIAGGTGYGGDVGVNNHPVNNVNASAGAVATNLTGVDISISNGGGSHHGDGPPDGGGGNCHDCD